MNVCTCPDRAALEEYVHGMADTVIDEHLEACVSCRLAVDALDAQDNAVFNCLRDTPVEATDPALRPLLDRAVALGGSTDPGNGTSADLPCKLGNYTLLELIGTGGMGQVFRAEHQRMKRVVALKLLAPQLVRSPNARARFLREVQATSRLSSPHIVAALDAGEADGRDYLAMEYVPGQTLADRVRVAGPLSIEQAIEWTQQAARGLQHAHEAGIVHRDVKPSNLQLTSAACGLAEVKILDLGLARLRQSDETSDLTGADGPMGTTHFMAPEQAASPRSVDERADIYSLGCTLYFLLTGKPPFDGDGAMAVLLAHRTQPIPRLRTARPDCPPALDALFRRLVAKRPEDRPASMAAVIEQLERVRRMPHAAGRRRWLPALAAAAAILLAVSLWPLFSSGLLPGFDDPPKRDSAQVVPGGDDADKKRDKAALPKQSPTLAMVAIPPGDFFMGASDSDKNANPNELPRKPVKIKNAFLMGRTEVTQGQYEEVMGDNPSAFSPKGKYAKLVQGVDTRQLPVESVAWIDAVRFCNRLSERHGLKSFYNIPPKGERVTTTGSTGYRLPTEAEWEYACRGGTQTTYYFGENPDKLGEHAWYVANSGDVTHPVGTKKANPFGLHDMYGNVPEWCWDKYDDRFYDYAPASDPVSRTTNTDRSIRGGAWNMAGNQLRTTFRLPLGATYGGPGSFHQIGFRVVRNAEP